MWKFCHTGTTHPPKKWTLTITKAISHIALFVVAGRAPHSVSMQRLHQFCCSLIHWTWPTLPPFRTALKTVFWVTVILDTPHYVFLYLPFSAMSGIQKDTTSLFLQMFQRGPVLKKNNKDSSTSKWCTMWTTRGYIRTSEPIGYLSSTRQSVPDKQK